VTTVPACTVAIFGAVGDLTKTLLMPAIYDLAAAGLLDEHMQFLGLDHNDRDTDGWRGEISDAIGDFAGKQGTDGQPGEIDARASSFVLKRLEYVRFDFTSDADYDALAQRLSAAGNVLFYLAVAPRFFEPIVAGLSRAGLLAETAGDFRRVVVEKPFGRDLESARQLNARLTSFAAESQLYRIDHFLGKEAVQGIPALRFANRFFEPLLSCDDVTSVQITAAETVGIAERGSFYESTGALRDMIPNHLLSLLTLVAMDEPRSFAAEDVRDAKVELLAALRPVSPHDAVAGQYAAGTVEGKPVRAYREEDNVAADSRTETYAAVRMHIENDRWRGVPFYLRTGKRMSAHVTTIALTLRAPTGPIDSDATLPHLLVLGIDPQRGLVQRFAAKRPGVDLKLGRADISFRYETTFEEPPNVGYETLLYHAMAGQPLLFQRADMIELEWAAVQPVLSAWEHADAVPQLYAAGEDGPALADDLLTRDGHRWFDVAPLETLGLEPRETA
jgi:glucose-6-phosphate 1-dehydrogenase